MTNLLTDLDKELDIKFNAFDHETKADLVVYLSNLRGKAIELHLALLNTPFSEGMKTAISEHQFALDLIKETISDLETAVLLNGDSEYNSIVDSFI